MRMKTVTRPFGMTLAGTLLWLASLASFTGAGGLSEFKPVPDATFHSLEGASRTLSDFRGRVVLVNFWGTWCVPCLQEIPELVRLARHFKERGFEVVGIAVESGRPEDVREFMAQHGMNYEILLGDLSTVKRDFHVVGFPTSLLIDRHGMVRKRYVGPQKEEAWTQDVEPLL